MTEEEIKSFGDVFFKCGYCGNQDTEYMEKMQRYTNMIHCNCCGQETTLLPMNSLAPDGVDRTPSSFRLMENTDGTP